MRRIPGGNLLAPALQGDGLLDLVQTRERCVPMEWGRFGVEPEDDQCWP
jgi:hypothetical protein